MIVNMSLFRFFLFQKAKGKKKKVLIEGKTAGTAHLFKAEQASWGYTRFMPLSHLHHFRRNLLINDTMIVKVEVDVLSVVPPIVFTEPAPHSRSDIARPDFDVQRIKETSYPPNALPAIDAHMDMDLNRFDSIISKLEAFIIASKKKEGSSSGNDSNRRLADLISGSPSLEEVEEAKESLEECLSDIFRLDMKDRLAAALLTSLRARVGLSVDQQKAITAFWNNFDDFISGFLMFDQTNYEYELQKLTHDQMFCAMKKSHETHLLNMQLLEALTEEGQELKKRMDEINSRMEKLISEMESLMAESKNMKSKYTAQEKKLAEAEEKKRVADERMSLSIAAWSSLKAQFLNPAAWL